MKNYIIDNYQYSGFFNHYFTSNDEWLHKPEQPLLDYVISQLPEYVKTVLIFGCAGGRDFIPFQDNYECIGFDLASPNNINWVCKKDNLSYYQCNIENYLDHEIDSDWDLSKFLVYTQGTLMYVSYETQTKLIKHFLNRGCKNMVIHEYPPEMDISEQGPNGNNRNANFNPDNEIIELFERKHFRSVIDRQPTGFLYLKK